MRIRSSDGAPRAAVAGAAAAVAGAVAALLLRLGRRRERGAEARERALQDDRQGGAEQTWRCACGQLYRVQGEGRHRVVWLIDADAADPVLEGRCPNCGRPLPGQEAEAAA